MTDLIAELAEVDPHADLVSRAVRWLRSNGCRVTLCDPFRANVQYGEQPDAIGWRDGLSILVEVKVSRADFLRDSKKRFRANPELGMGDWRFYLAPAGLISVDELPRGWGLLEHEGRSVRRVHGGPKGNVWWSDVPFTGNKRNETSMLVSALAQPQQRPPVTRRGMTDYSAWADQAMHDSAREG